MSDQVFYPEEIEQEALPVLGSIPIPQDQNITSEKKGDSYSPQTRVDERFPSKFIAPAVISDSINTLTKQILGDYSFGVLGAISIGTYEETVSGDIRITPTGIAARNVNGDTTFSLDGVTGDATFLGTLQAGTLIGGDNKVKIGLSGAGKAQILLLDESNVPIICIGDPTV